MRRSASKIVGSIEEQMNPISIVSIVRFEHCLILDRSPLLVEHVIKIVYLSTSGYTIFHTGGRRTPRREVVDNDIIVECNDSIKCFVEL